MSGNSYLRSVFGLGHTTIARSSNSFTGILVTLYIQFYMRATFLKLLHKVLGSSTSQELQGVYLTVWGHRKARAHLVVMPPGSDLWT